MKPSKCQLLKWFGYSGECEMDLHILVYTGLLFLLGEFGGRLAEVIKLPRLIGYLLFGVLFGPFVIGLFSQKIINEHLRVVVEIALSFIAFSIGGSIKFERIKQLKRAILAITFFQAFAAFILVFLAVSFFLPYFVFPLETGKGFIYNYLPIALILGAVSAATAPAAIMSLVHEYRSRGVFTTILLALVALDDGLVVIFFALVTAFVQLLLGSDAISWVNTLGKPFLELLECVGLGVIIWFFLRMIIAFFKPHEMMLGLITGAILFTSGIAESFGFSSLLSVMILGFLVANFIAHPQSDEAIGVIKGIEEPIFAAFFVLAGAHLDLFVAWSAGFLALVLTISRFVGKMIGTWVGANLGKAPTIVKRYLGFALLPTAGVAIGLTLKADALFSAYLPKLCDIMISAVIGAAIINEFSAPFLVRYALHKSGEAR
jgi:Kef-type K+ transport system membrane component KefB